ncbi:hypothetical protein [Kordia sp.]|uniref:hypothetical protein n=1 Tax=Kordia sp. TaxID=1965332 RepID=UPI003D6AA1C4
MKTSKETKIKNYEKQLHDLVGKSIVAVDYYELVYEEPLWDEDEYHSLDYGLEIITSDENRYYFIWGKEFEQFDVKFKKGDILKEFVSEISFNKYNVTNNVNWKVLIEKEIKDVKTIWSYSTYKGRKEKYYYPQEIILTFENEKEVIISALEIIDRDPLFMKDHISVFFDKKVFERLTEV